MNNSSLPYVYDNFIAQTGGRITPYVNWSCYQPKSNQSMTPQQISSLNPSGSQYYNPGSLQSQPNVYYSPYSGNQKFSVSSNLNYGNSPWH